MIGLMDGLLRNNNAAQAFSRTSADNAKESTDAGTDTVPADATFLFMLAQTIAGVLPQQNQNVAITHSEVSRRPATEGMMLQGQSVQTISNANGGLLSEGKEAFVDNINSESSKGALAVNALVAEMTPAQAEESVSDLVVGKEASARTSTVDMKTIDQVAQVFDRTSNSSSDSSGNVARTSDKNRTHSEDDDILDWRMNLQYPGSTSQATSPKNVPSDLLNDELAFLQQVETASALKVIAETFSVVMPLVESVREKTTPQILNHLDERKIEGRKRDDGEKSDEVTLIDSELGRESNTTKEVIVPKMVKSGSAFEEESGQRTSGNEESVPLSEDESPSSKERVQSEHLVHLSTTSQAEPAKSAMPTDVGFIIHSVHRNEEFAADAITKSRSTLTHIPEDFARTLVVKISDELKAHIEGKGSEVRVVMKPEAMGELSLRVSMEEGKLAATLDVSHPAVRSALEAQLPQLREALTSQGIDIQRFEIISSGDEMQFKHSKDGHAFQQPSSRFRRENTDVNVAETYDGIKYLGYNTVEYII